MIRPILLTALSLVLAGCATTTTTTTPEPAPAPAPAPAVTEQDLTAARYPGCAYVGPLVLRYLATGNNEGHPWLDNAYAYYVGVSPPVARATANDATAKCDAAAEQRRLEAQRQAEAEAQRQRDEAERQRRAAGLDRARAYCTGHGGTVEGDAWCKAPRADADPAQCGQWLALDADTGRLRYPDITPAQCWT
jgi:hypothetical protein